MYPEECCETETTASGERAGRETLLVRVAPESEPLGEAGRVRDEGSAPKRDEIATGSGNANCDRSDEECAQGRAHVWASLPGMPEVLRATVHDMPCQQCASPVLPVPETEQAVRAYR